MAKKASGGAKKTATKTKKTTSAPKTITEFDLVNGSEFTTDTTLTKKDELKEYKPNTYTLPDIMNAVFTDEYLFKQFTDSFLEQQFFLLNRRFSIKYPLQAQAFNLNGINQAEAMKCWKMFLRAKERSKFTPAWVWTKNPAVESAKAQESPLDKFEADIITGFLIKKKWSKRDLDDAMKFFPEDVIAEIEHYNYMQKEWKKTMFSSGKGKKEE